MDGLSGAGSDGVSHLLHGLEWALDKVTSSRRENQVGLVAKFPAESMNNLIL